MANKKKESTGKKVAKYAGVGLLGHTATSMGLASRAQKVSRQAQPVLLKKMLPQLEKLTNPSPLDSVKIGYKEGKKYRKSMQRFKAGRKFIRNQRLALGAGTLGAMGAYAAYRKKKGKGK